MTTALIPRIALTKGNGFLINLLLITSGVILLSLLAQITFQLPWTPVPITGQTFGVMMISLLWGRKRGFGVLATYLCLGSIGLPVFALGRSGLFGATQGYLWGMLLASVVVGHLSDKGWTSSFLKTWLCCTLGSIIVFSLGLFVLSYYVSPDKLLYAGLLPFIPGDILKNVLAATMATRINQKCCRP